MMNIDILPTIAEITGANLPEKKIDGKSLWKVWTGESAQSPQQAYFFYYHQNELHGVRYGDKKMYFPHRYRTMSGRPGGKDGYPGKYDYVNLEQSELYDLSEDISETQNISDADPEIIKKINALADSIRLELGDKLSGISGSGSREVGRVDDLE